MCHIFFIRSSVDGHLVGSMSWLLQIVLQWTSWYMSHFELWFSLGICPVVGLLGHMVVLSLVVLRNLRTVFQCLYQFTFPSTVQEGSIFTTPFPTFIISRFFDNAILTSVRWYLTVVLIWILQVTRELSIFLCVCCQSVCLLWKNIYSGLLPIF